MRVISQGTKNVNDGIKNANLQTLKKVADSIGFVVGLMGNVISNLKRNKKERNKAKCNEVKIASTVTAKRASAGALTSTTE